MSTQRCVKSGCQTETTEGYCDLHRCATNGCRDARKASQYCADHVICTKFNCKSPQCINNEFYSRRPLCIDHWYTCRAPDCTEPELSTELKYCRHHKCQNTGCEERIADIYQARLFCTVHGCRALTWDPYRGNIFKCGGYGADANAGRSYCTGCTCKEPECSAERTTSSACRTHRCPSLWCDQPREPNASYCIQHKICSKQFCNEARKVGGLYCSKHEIV